MSTWGAPVRLSLLDQSPITDHLDRAGAVQESLLLATAAEKAGYHRFWFAEHHDSASFASAAPEIMTALALERTSRMRVGTGGILLPLHTVQKVTETLGLLRDVHGDRVDIGIGRAALRGGDFREKATALASVLDGSPDLQHIEPTRRLWLLGAGGSSAPFAASLGAGYAHAHFLSPATGMRALRAYQDQAMPRNSHSILAVRVVAAATAEKARALADAMALWRARKDLGGDGPIPSIRRLARHEWTDAEHAQATVRVATIGLCQVS